MKTHSLLLSILQSVVAARDEQFERVVLKRIRAYPSGAKSCGDVVVRLGGIRRAQAKAEAEPITLFAKETTKL